MTEIPIIPILSLLKKEYLAMFKYANNYDRQILEKKLASEDFKRVPLSFYRYVHIVNPEELQKDLYKEWKSLGVLGRIYLAKEGVNAQLCIPE